jgi:D-serine deaminase-like pyridoxal phosphate-dependent protein
MAAQVARSRHLELRGFYTHEGNFYTIDPEQQAQRVEDMIGRLAAVRDAIDGALPIWPGCSVTARQVARTGAGRVQAVRPGAYVFGDLYLTSLTGAMPRESVALHVLATVVDKPEAGLALIDAGSKTFSSDRTPDGLSARVADGRDIAVVRVNEEHGFLRGADISTLRIGERLEFVPAHVCPVVNLASHVVVRAGDRIIDQWRVDARGRTQ